MKNCDDITIITKYPTQENQKAMISLLKLNNNSRTTTNIQKHNKPAKISPQVEKDNELLFITYKFFLVFDNIF